MKKITDLHLENKRVLIRVDFNVPVQQGKVLCDIRIRESIPTIQKVLDMGAAVILLSHLGRPKEGIDDPNFSLEPIAKRLSELLGRPVIFKKKWLDGLETKPGEVILCENVRFNVGEKENSDALSKKMAKLGDVFINDAFATAHRSEASIVGIPKYIKEKAIGLLFLKEIENLSNVIKKPRRPVITILGGAKVFTKLKIIWSVINFSDTLIVGGGIANTFLASLGLEIGKSLCEHELIDEGKKIIDYAREKQVRMLLPIDVVVTKEFCPEAKTAIKKIGEIERDDIIVDFGPKSVEQAVEAIHQAATILWNGPVGASEIAAFETGTKMIAEAIVNSTAYSIAGGGDIMTVLEKFHLDSKMSYISTGGGAFLAYLEKGNQLPAIVALE